MNEPIQEKNVILTLLATLIIVFILIFSTVSNKGDFKDSIQWRESNTNDIQSYVT